MHGVKRVIIMWDISSISRGWLWLFCLLEKRDLVSVCVQVTANFSSPQNENARGNIVRCTFNIKSRQYTATGAGTWLNFCIVMKAANRILFFGGSELACTCIKMQSSHLDFPQKINAVWLTRGKAEAWCDISLRQDEALVFTTAVSPQNCSQSLSR